MRLETSRAQVGRAVPAVVSVHNAGAISRTGMSLSLHVHNTTVPDCSADLEFPLPALPPHSRSEFEVQVPCTARGVHRVENLTVIANDPIGVFHRRRRFDEYHNFLGLPRSFGEDGMVPWELLSPEGRRASQTLQRSSGDLRGVRRFDLGDDLRHVHWKVSAHTGELVVKQYRQRRGAEVTIWLDLWEANHVVGGTDSPTETAISLAATLIALFVRGEYQVSLAGHGLPPDLQLPSRGEAYLDRAMVALAQATPQVGPSFCDFCIDQARVTPRLGSVFCITPAAEADLEDALTSIGSRGAHVTVLFADGSGAGPDPRPERLSAEGIAAMADRLRARNVRAVEVGSLEGIPAALGELAGEAAREVVA